MQIIVMIPYETLPSKKSQNKKYVMRKEQKTVRKM